jgi:hypothetical protein
VATHADHGETHLSGRSPYLLRSSSQSTLLLRSPLRTPKRWSRINLVSDSIAASTAVSGGNTDPDAVSDSTKLDQLLGLVTTMNTRLDR